MVNSISSTSHVTQANEAVKASAPQSQQTQQKTAPQPSDTVTLKSTASASPSGDNK